MLDIPAYRESENHIRQYLNQWISIRRHNLDIFEKAGFPVRVNCIQEIRTLLGSMQEGRCDAFMEDVGGLSEKQLELVVQVARDVVRFQETTFPRRQLLMPFDNILAYFSTYSKLCALKPDFESVLEIGPGASMLSFYLSRHRPLKNYTQIEACESFYLLQSLINNWQFESAFEENAFLESIFVPHDSSNMPTTNKRHEKVCHHYPWWKIEEVSSAGQDFDVIVSNANLLEFSELALDEYLQLVSKKLRDDGLFFVQCFGSGPMPIEKLWSKMHENRLAPLCITSNVYTDVERLMHNLAGKHKRLLIAPAGLGTRLLVANTDFVNSMEEIVLVDNFRSEAIQGLKVVKPEDIGSTGIRDALIVYEEGALNNEYRDSFSRHSVKVHSLGEFQVSKTFAVPYGVFVGEGHEEYDSCHARGNYSARPLDKHSRIAKTFLSKNGKRYTVEELAALVERIL